MSTTMLVSLQEDENKLLKPIFRTSILESVNEAIRYYVGSGLQKK